LFKFKIAHVIWEEPRREISTIAFFGTRAPNFSIEPRGKKMVLTAQTNIVQNSH